MKKLLLSTASAIVLAQAAGAADLQLKAPPPLLPPLWTGWYVGLDGGVVHHDAFFNDLSNVFRTGTFSSNQTGGFVGVNAGFNWQQGSFVYGIEADWNWVGAKAGETWGCPLAFCSSLVTSHDVPWIATVRGRAGLAVDATLFYFTGGLAFGQVKNSALVFTGPGNGNVLLASTTENTTRVGWTAGAGVEHMITRNWTVRAELRYVDLGRSTRTCVPGGAALDPDFCAGYRGQFSNSMFKGLVGVDYKF
jgi:outer membrane immunogenic protein